MKLSVTLMVRASSLGQVLLLPDDDALSGLVAVDIGGRGHGGCIEQDRRRGTTLCLDGFPLTHNHVMGEAIITQGADQSHFIWPD